MNATPSSQAAITRKLELIHTQVGFDLLADPGDYISILLLRDGIHEAAETDLVTHIVRAGDTCIDAGCQVGYYSCLLARLVGQKGRVYAFDANPLACQSTRRNLGLNGFVDADVIQTALGDRSGAVQFYVSMDDQTGLSSLGAIPICKETIKVRSERLDAFLSDRGIGSVRLLKLDVEGAEEIVLRGLGRFLAAHTIDFILAECFDERLQLLNSSTEVVAGILASAGYTCWEFGRHNPVGWSQVSKPQSRGDCSYLFASPAVTSGVPVFSLAGVLGWARSQWQDQRNQLVSEIAFLKENADKLQDDIDWLLTSINAREEQGRQLAAEGRQLAAEGRQLAAEKRSLAARVQEVEAVLKAVENSVSYRMLKPLRKARDWVARR